jgi:hypothetical protein
VSYPIALQVRRKGHKTPTGIILGAPTMRDGEAVAPMMVWPPEICPKCKQQSAMFWKGRDGTVCVNCKS